MKRILIFRLEGAIIHQVKNGSFDIECVAQYHQNTRERLRIFKAGGALSVLFSGLILSICGFDEKLTLQSSQTITNIRLWYLIYPLVVVGITIFMTTRYSVTQAVIEEIKIELQNRRRQDV